MSRLQLLIVAAAAALFAAPALAQDDSNATETDGVVVTGSRIVRQDFESISPVTTVGSETLDMSDETHMRLGWREDQQRTANRARNWRANGASAVRVIRACEISLTLGDEDCAAN